MIKLLHWCALRISSLGEYIWELGGTLECWCDEQHWEKVRKAHVSQWAQWMQDHPPGDEVIKAWEKYDYNVRMDEAIEAWLAVRMPAPRSFNGMNAKEAYDLLKQQQEEEDNG